MRKAIAKFSEAYNAYRDARTPRYVGRIRLPYVACNAITGMRGEGVDYIHFYRTPRGKRTVKVTDRKLRQTPAVQAYLLNGTLPLAA